MKNAITAAVIGSLALMSAGAAHAKGCHHNIEIENATGKKVVITAVETRRLSKQGNCLNHKMQNVRWNIASGDTITKSHKVRRNHKFCLYLEYKKESDKVFKKWDRFGNYRDKHIVSGCNGTYKFKLK